MKEKTDKTIEQQMRELGDLKRMSLRTVDGYVSWYKRFVRFHEIIHPIEMGEEDVEAFLTYLATERKVAASTQNQAFSALVYLYREYWTRS